MSEPHDYIGLSAATSSSSCSSSPNPAAAAELGPRLTLRLGLPGSDSPDRDANPAALTLGLVSHKPAAKRAFPDASPRRAAAAEKAPPAAPPAAK
jgi:auxin-responsive protein IAA